MTVTIIVTLVILFDLAVTVVLVKKVVGGTWAPLAERFPPVEPAPDAVTKRFQSYRFGLMSLGCAVHTTADDAHLHLVPARFVSVFGIGPVSIPWERIDVRGRSRSGRTIKASVDHVRFEGPAWCLELAEAPPDEADAAG